MSNFAMLLAQTDAAAEANDGGAAFLGFLIIGGGLWAICAACSRKKEYDIHMAGKIRERS